MDNLTTTSVIWIALAGLVTLALVSGMGLFGNQFPVDGKTVLITGASEGLGLEASKQLAAKGANVVLVSRSVEKLEKALKEVQAAAKNLDTQRFTYISADVATPSYAPGVVSQVIEWNDGKAPDIVWCIAGMSTPQLFTDMEMSSMRQQVDVNYFGTTEMSHAILREWLAPDAPIEKQPKHLVFTVSSTAFYSIPGYAPYTPAKAAVKALADILAQEMLLYPQNVKVSVVYPGTILSPGFARETLFKPEITKILEEDDPRQTPAEVANVAIRGLEKGEHYVTVNWLGWLMKVGALGGSIRNNWFVDIVGAWLAALSWVIVQQVLHGKMRSYAKKHGHPSTWKKHEA